MIEISFGKLLVLALIALIVLGPEKLPAAARTAGALVRRLRGSWDSVRAEVERELQVEEIRRTAREAAERMEAAQTELDGTLQQVRDVAANAAGETPATGLTDGETNASAIADPLDVVTLDSDVGDSGEPQDIRTGDLFAGTPSRPPPASAVASAPPEPTRGTD
ncbi:MAG: Sec-independent protein translocase protein TatB [Rhodanobacter sp.]